MTSAIGASKLSKARKVVDSTLKRLLIYTAEIIASIILLILICLPLAFTVPMWVQRVFLDTPTNELWINPIAWFSAGGAVAIVILLALLSIFLGYLYIWKMTPAGITTSSVEGEEEDNLLDEEEGEELESSDDEREED